MIIEVYFTGDEIKNLTGCALKAVCVKKSTEPKLAVLLGKSKTN
jgi:hypothetical protein